MKKLLLKTNINYSWFILAAGFLIMAAAWGIIFNCASLFITPISEELGFKRSYVSAIITLSMLSQMILSVMSGKIFSKINIKLLMRIASLTISISYFTYSLANSLAEFYLITIIASVSSAFLTTLPLSLIINNWFYDKKGLAIGLAFMGSGIGGMILNALTGVWIELYGFRIAYRFLSVIMAVILIPCVFFIIEIDPKDINFKPFYSNGCRTVQIQGTGDGITLSEAAKTIKFWILMLCFMAGSMALATSFFTISPHMIDSGYNLTTSAYITALTMGALALSKLILGKMFDNFGLRVSVIVSILLNIAGLLGLIFVNYKVLLIIIVIGTGFGNAFGTIAFPIITARIYGQKDFSSIYGLFSAAGSLGGVIAPTINGMVFDKTGSYDTSYICMIILSVGIIAIFQLILPAEKERI